MRNLPKEWLAGGIAALIALVLFLLVPSVEKGGVMVSARGTYDGAPMPEPRWLGPDFAGSWPAGKDPFTPATDRRDLPAEDLGLPDFPANAAPAFLPRPTVDMRIALPKHLTIVATDLPADAALVTLREAGKTPVGEVAPPEAAAVLDTIVTPMGNVSGIIVKEEANGTVQLRVKGGQTRTFKKGEYSEIQRGETVAKKRQRESDEIAASTNSLTHETLGDACLKDLQLDLAVHEYEVAVGLNIKEATLAKLGGAYAMLADPDREVRFYRRLIEKKQSGIEQILARLGRIYEALGLPTRAVDSYQTAIKFAPFHVESRVRLVILFSSEGRIPEAETHLNALNADTTRQKLADAKLATGTLAYVAGRFDAAKAALTEAGPIGASLLGCTELYLGNGKAAVEALTAALTANPDAIDSWINLGLACGLAGDWAKAQGCFDEAAFRAPVSANPWAASGWGLLKQAKPAEAKVAFDEAIRRDPRCAYALLCSGKLILDGGDPVLAETLLLSALKSGAGGPAYRELGLARLRQKNSSGAAEALRRASDFAGDPDAHALRGFALLATRADEAEQEFRRALQVDPTHVLASCGMAAVAYNRRQIEETKAKFDGILSRVPDNAYALRGKKLASEASTRWLWEDDFERKDNESLLHGWVEREKEGIRIRLARGRAVVLGKQNRDDTFTSMIRPTTDKFLAFEAELDFTKTSRATAGIAVGIAPTQGVPAPVVLRFARLASGKLAVFVGPLTQAPVWKEVGESPGMVVRLRIEKVPAGNGGDWIISANGAAIGTPIRAELRQPKLEASAWGSSFKDDSWELTVDTVRLIEAKEGK